MAAAVQTQTRILAIDRRLAGSTHAQALLPSGVSYFPANGSRCLTQEKDERRSAADYLQGKGPGLFRQARR